MATDKYSKVEEGGIQAEISIPMIASESIPMWAPLKLVANASITNGLPKVALTSTLNDTGIIGVSVGGTGPIESGTAANADGKTVQVQIYGLAKVKVDGNASNIAIGDNLITHGADGVAQKVTAYPATYSNTDVARNVFAKALQASTVDGDVIAIFLTGGSQ